MSNLVKAAGLAAGIVTLFAVSGEAYAQTAAYCAVAGGRNSYENCGYYTLAQCRAAVSGVGGFCQPNPRFVYTPYADEEPAYAPRRQRSRRAY